jgi:hypothetical protein
MSAHAPAEAGPTRSIANDHAAARAWPGVRAARSQLLASGLVRTSKLATQKHFQANADSPIYAELVSIARKTVGLAQPLREALAPFESKSDSLGERVAPIGPTGESSNDNELPAGKPGPVN